jgi:predicted phage tail protein
MTNKTIRGAGGGGKGGGGAGRVAVEAPDSLRSKAFARVLDLISEGEIVGLVDGSKSIFLDETPLQNEDGSYNFQGLEIDTRNGTQSQGYIAGFPAIESENGVGVEVKNSASVTRQISNTEVDAVRVRISIPQLTEQNTSNGDLNGSSVTYAIDVQSNGGGFVQYLTDTVRGKTTSKYERTYRVQLTGSAPWDIRVRRVSIDPTTVSIQNKTFWESYTEIIDAKLRYPNSALVGIKIDSSQFNSIPRRAYDVKLLKVRVPSNYNAETRTYSGIWDGTFQIAWTDNPAWCFYDLLTNDRYGLGGLIDESQVDKWALYAVARYCDELVPDGFGGTEPRFTCNMYIQSRAEAYQVIQDMASIFRGMAYWQSGAITVSQDAPADPAYLFTPANVVNGTFVYSGSSAKARHTVALVSWNDPDDFYRQKVEYVEDAAGIARYGIIQTDVSAIGCTSRGQANRVGRWLLYSEQSEAEVVVFKTGIEGAVARPGQIIQVADPVRGGARRGGRIASANVSAITLDSPVTLSGSGHTLAVILPDGSVEEKEVASVSGSTVLVASPFSAVPAPGAIWVIQSPNLQAQTFRVVSAVEAEDGIEINALAHNPAKFDAIEQGLVLQPRQISALSLVPDAPTNILVTETLYESAAEVKTLISVSWDAVQGATSYQVSYKVGDGNYTSLPEVTANSTEVRDATDGLYTFRVVAVNPVGKKSAAATKTQTILSTSAPPIDVQNFSLIPVAGMAYLSWDKAADLDVLVGGTVRIRWTPKTVGADWNDAVDILPAMSGNQRNATAPLLAGTYMAKFVDGTGNPSQNATFISTEVADSQTFNVVETVTESSTFAGTKTNCEVVAGELVISTAGNGTVLPSATYVFANGVDLGSVYPSRVSAYIEARGYALSDFIDARVQLIDTWEDFDGAAIETVTGLLYMRTTNDNPAGSPVWTEWKPFFVGEYTARAYQFKLEMTSDNFDHNIGISALAVMVDMPDRVESKTGLVSGAGSYSVTFTEAFKTTPTIGVTANNMASGDYYAITGQSATGFDIIFKNAAGTAVSRTFDVIAKGYGRSI